MGNGDGCSAACGWCGRCTADHGDSDRPRRWRTGTTAGFPVGAAGKRAATTDPDAIGPEPGMQTRYQIQHPDGRILGVGYRGDGVTPIAYWVPVEERIRGWSWATKTEAMLVAVREGEAWGLPAGWQVVAWGV